MQLTWQPSVAAQGRIVGYRVLRDGAMIGQFAQTTATLAHLAPSTTYTFTVLAVDSYGAVSPPATSVNVTTANPTPSTGHVYTFLLADTGQSFQDFQAHYQEIGTVSPTYYDCNGSGNLAGGNVPLITSWAQAREVKVLPRFNCQSGGVIDNILNNQALRQQWLSGIMSEVNANGYDGVTIDFEAGYPQDRNAYTAFVTDLAAQLHAENKTLALAVSAKTADVPNHPRSTFFDYNGLSAQADAVIVMCWGVHWTTSAPGAQDDMTWVRQVVAYVTTLPRLNKYILGMQLYAMDWPNGGGSANPATAMEYQYAMNLAASEGVTPTHDPTADAWTFSYTDAANVPHTVWYTDCIDGGRSRRPRAAERAWRHRGMAAGPRGPTAVDQPRHHLGVVVRAVAVALASADRPVSSGASRGIEAVTAAQTSRTCCRTEPELQYNHLDVEPLCLRGRIGR